jgi:aspartyl-tRNA synthetase
LILLVAGSNTVANIALGQLRVHLAEQENWITPNQYSFAWIIDFPLFEFDATEKTGT